MLVKLVSKPGENRVWIAVLKEGEEAKQSLLEIAKQEKIEDASFVALGAFAKATVAYFDWQKKKYQDIPVDEQVEVITLIGDIVPDEKGKPSLHAHTVLGRSDGSTRGGHLQEGHVRPTLEITITEIPGVIEDYRKAAARAKAAGFDGVEVHSGNGYLLDQFLQDGSNQRTDSYGGSIENRSRLLLDVVEAVASVWGGERVAVRIAPGGSWNGMSDSNPTALFAYVAEQLNRFGLAYLHIIEPRVKGNVVIAEGQAPIASEQLRKIFKGKIIAAGGFEPDTAETVVEKSDADLVAFGRHFVSNPDLPKRIKLALPLNPYDRDTFYTFDARGYTDYPFYDGLATS